MTELVEIRQKAQELGTLVTQLGDSLDLPKINAEIASLEAEQNQEGFWNDQAKAKTVSSRLAALQNKKERYLKAASSYDDIKSMLGEATESDTEVLDLIASMEEDPFFGTINGKS